MSKAIPIPVVSASASGYESEDNEHDGGKALEHEVGELDD